MLRGKCKAALSDSGKGGGDAHVNFNLQSGRPYYKNTLIVGEEPHPVIPLDASVICSAALRAAGLSAYAPAAQMLCSLYVDPTAIKPESSSCSG